MALDSYTALVATIGAYIERADLDFYIPTFIELAEKRLARRLGLSENEVQTRLDLVLGRAPLPDDYASWRAVNGDAGWSLDYVPPHLFLGRYGYSYGLNRRRQGDGYDYEAWGVYGGRGRFFTILGSIPLDDVDADISIWPGGLDRPFILTGPAWTGQLSLVYRQGISPLGANNATNWLLKKAPDLYLYAALAEAEPFLKNEARLPLWRSMMEEGISDVQTLDREARWGRSRMMSDEVTP
jgi:hypothetical protein